MWLFTKHGFVSAVRHRDRDGWVIVRARRESDLRLVLSVYDDPRDPLSEPVESTPKYDYPWRTTMRMSQWTRLLEALSEADEFDYTNFKNAAKESRGTEYASSCHDVWSCMYAYGRGETRRIPRFYYGPGGALVCDQPVDGASGLSPESAEFYGGRWMLAESMSRRAAENWTEMFGGELVDEPFIERGVTP